MRALLNSKLWLGAIVLTLLSFSHSPSQACSRRSADSATESSNMRQVVIAVLTRYYEPNAHYQPERYQTMEDFLLLMARVELIDSSVFFNRIEFKEFSTTPPEIIGSSVHEASPPPKLDPDFLQYPIGYSVAIYPTLLDLPASRTPLLWTRDLHSFRKFDAPYSGFIAYLDGHVTYYEGEPDKHDPELIEVFSDNAPSADALRILKHIPNGWTEQAPLPVRYAYITRKSFFERLGLAPLLLPPAVICGLLAGIFSDKNQCTYRRILNGAAIFFIVLLLAAILVPSVC